MERAAEPRTLHEAVQYFADPVNVRDYLVVRRWPNGVECPRCGSKDVIFMEKYNRWQCREKHDARQFTLKTGTIFEDSPIGLDKWMLAMWQVVNCKNGVSSYEIHRALGVTQKTAWFMNHRIRTVMQDEMHGGKLGGEVEVDETFIGGKARNMHKDRKRRALEGKGGGHVGKVGVQGMMERGGKVRAEVIENTKEISLKPNVWKHVEAGSTVYTDEAHGYRGLQADYDHQVINHLESYVNGNVHTNGIENFWSLLKRGLNGTYVSVEPFHLFRYVDEQAFRYNNRKPMDDGDRFSYLVRKVVGKRLTYDELTGKTDLAAETTTQSV
ncbi:MAG: IS1595 family transposase [Bryobacteraceae bacterium]|jgi:transposase-like protein